MTQPQYQWPRGLRKQILERDGYQCQIRTPLCTGHATAIDHITPIAAGGAWFDPNNLRAACTQCNSAISNPKSKHHRIRCEPSRQW